MLHSKTLRFSEKNRAKHRHDRLPIYFSNNSNLKKTNDALNQAKPITKECKNHKTGNTWSLGAGDWPVQENQPMTEAGRRRVSRVFQKLPAHPFSSHARHSDASTRNRVSLPGTHGTEDARMLIYYKTEQIQIE